MNRVVVHTSSNWSSCRADPRHWHHDVSSYDALVASAAGRGIAKARLWPWWGVVRKIATRSGVCNFPLLSGNRLAICHFSSWEDSGSHVILAPPVQLELGGCTRECAPSHRRVWWSPLANYACHCVDLFMRMCTVCSTGIVLEIIESGVNLWALNCSLFSFNTL